MRACLHSNASALKPRRNGAWLTYSHPKTAQKLDNNVLKCWVV